MSAPSSRSAPLRAAPRARWPDPSGSCGDRRTAASSRRPRGTARRTPTRTSRRTRRSTTSRAAVVVERRADRADAAVHHVGRRDHVGAGLRVGQRRVGQPRQRSRRCPHPPPSRAVERAAVAVVGVLAQADVGPQRQVRTTRAAVAASACGDRARRDRPRRALGILAVGDAEQDHARHAERRQLAALLDEHVDAHAGRSPAWPRSHGGRLPRRRRTAARRSCRATGAFRAPAGAIASVRRSRRGRCFGKLTPLLPIACEGVARAPWPAPRPTAPAPRHRRRAQHASAAVVVGPMARPGSPDRKTTRMPPKPAGEMLGARRRAERDGASSVPPTGPRPAARAPPRHGLGAIRDRRDDVGARS